jgi:hypothetical protein
MQTAVFTCLRLSGASVRCGPQGIAGRKDPGETASNAAEWVPTAHPRVIHVSAIISLVPWKATAVELDDLLSALDRAAANLVKLEGVWGRAQSHIPTGPQRGSHPEYEDLSRAWADLLTGLPPIDGWTITDQLPDVDALGELFLDSWEIGVDSFQARTLPSTDSGSTVPVGAPLVSDSDSSRHSSKPPYLR